MANSAEDLDKCFEVVSAVIEKAGDVRIYFLVFCFRKNHKNKQNFKFNF